MKKYLSLTDFVATLSEADSAFFCTIWKQIVQKSPTAYTLLNTEIQWKQHFAFLRECDFMCVYRCSKSIKVDELGCTYLGGCYEMQHRAL